MVKKTNKQKQLTIPWPETIKVDRSRVRELFDYVSSRPWRIISVECARRETLYLRYPPVSQYKNGPYVRIGDHCKINDRRSGVIYDEFGECYELKGSSINRRRGVKVVIQAAGEFRWMIVKSYDFKHHTPTKHWQPKGQPFPYSLREHELYLLQGMYSDMVQNQPTGEKMIGRFGGWRPFACVCLRTVRCLRADGLEYIIR